MCSKLYCRPQESATSIRDSVVMAVLFHGDPWIVAIRKFHVSATRRTLQGVCPCYSLPRAVNRGLHLVTRRASVQDVPFDTLPPPPAAHPGSILGRRSD